MKRIYLLFFILGTSICLSYAQVETRFFSNGDAGKQVRQSKQAKTIISMPSFDLAAIQKEDEERDKKPGLFRFGKGFDVSYTLADGQWEDVEDGRLWTMTFESKDALSLNFVFNDFYLPEGAELYILNKDETVLYGPVTMEATTKNGVFLTDIIEGSQATLYLYEPSGSTGQSHLTIKRVIHGYRNNNLKGNNNTRSITSSYAMDIACSPDYEKESDAVGIAIYPTGDCMCTGALVMTTDYSFRSLFLTTFFFLDENMNNEITETEIADAHNSLFKFRYRLQECNGDIWVTSYTYNQADFLSAWYNTTFALLEIHGNLKRNPYLTWLGWSKYESTPSMGACIHHPYMRSALVSTCEDNLTSNLHGYAWSGYFTSMGNSSVGAPLLNADKQIIGLGYYGVTYSSYFGKFCISWAGGGSDSTRLSNWLAPDYSGIYTMDSYRSIIINGPSKIVSSSTYSVLNLPSGMSVTWSISDSYYNQNCLQQNYPSSNQCTITRDYSHSMSGATLTATIKHNNATICSFEKTISAGDGFGGTYFNGLITKQIDLPIPLFVLPETTVTINSSDLIGATVSHYGGDSTPTSWAFNGTTGVLQVGMPSSIGATVVVKAVTSDNIIYYLPIITTTTDYELLYAMQNGSSIEVRALPAQTFPLQDGSSSSTDLAWQMDIYNIMTGEIAYSEKVVGVSKRIDTTGWKSGVYIIRANIGKETYSKKVIVK